MHIDINVLVFNRNGHKYVYTFDNSDHDYYFLVGEIRQHVSTGLIDTDIAKVLLESAKRAQESNQTA